MPFKGTDKLAYKKAGKFPKIMRSSVYKIIKSYNKSSMNGLMESRNKPQINILKPSNRSIIIPNHRTNPKLYYFAHDTTNSKSQLIIKSQLTQLAEKKVRELSRDVFYDLSEYIVKRSIQISSRTFRIVISLGKILVQAVNIYQERENYEMLIEVMNGEISFNENYEELKAFTKMHFDIFKQICVLSKDIIGASVV